MSAGGRWIAQDAITREFLHWNVPIDGEPQRALNASGTLQGKISPTWPDALGADGRLILEPWRTLLHYEASDVIRWTGIVWDTPSRGPELGVSASTHSTYLKDLPYLGDEYVGIQIDPADALRRLWAHAQSFPGSNLGVTVIGSTPVRIGTEEEDVAFETGAGDQVAFSAGPYRLAWWDQRDSARERDDLAKQGSFDWYDRSRWNDDRTDVILETVVAHPRAGRRLPYRFAEGENITETLEARTSGSTYANTVEGIGAGEGQGMLRRSVGATSGRLRRVKLVPHKDVTSAERLDALVAAELAASSGAIEFQRVRVIEHDHAPLTAIELGDDLLIQANSDYHGRQRILHRVLGIEQVGPSTLELTTARSDRYPMGATA